MDDGMDVGPHFVDQHMHGHLTGRLTRPAHFVSPGVDNHHIVRLDEAFVAAGRRAHDVAVRQTNADVAIHRGDVLLLINQMAELCNVFCNTHGQDDDSTTFRKASGKAAPRLFGIGV